MIRGEPRRLSRRLARVVLLGALLATAGLSAAGPANAGTISDPTGRCRGTYVRRVSVSSGAGLSRALAGARPGDYIHLADGWYHGQFSIRTSGTSSRRIIVCGSRRAFLMGASAQSGYGLSIRASYVTFAGFSITRSLKGIMLDRSSHVVLRGLSVYGIGDEGVHFRTFSRYNVLELSTVRDTGLYHVHSGEGVYVGSAKSNWATYTGGLPDQSSYNVIRNNVIGPRTTAESVDVKEGTTGTQIVNNTFSGVGMNATAGADSWVDVKGNRATITDNVGTSAPLDGFQLHVVATGWGNGNTFARNTANVDSTGYGFRLSSAGSGNIVRCDNVVNGAGAGTANVACMP